MWHSPRCASTSPQREGCALCFAVFHGLAIAQVLPELAVACAIFVPSPPCPWRRRGCAAIDANTVRRDGNPCCVTVQHAHDNVDSVLFEIKFLACFLIKAAQTCSRGGGEGGREGVQEGVKGPHTCGARGRGDRRPLQGRRSHRDGGPVFWASRPLRGRGAAVALTQAAAGRRAEGRGGRSRRAGHRRGRRGELSVAQM